tara:strand:- start:493 stop:735 length:243 start_codon:yes stop_codon:yes gene_type:complete
MSKQNLNDCHLAKVTKADFDYWYGKGALKGAVKLQGDVTVLVEEKDFKMYMETPHRPNNLLSLAMYENYEELKGVFYGKV